MSGYWKKTGDFYVKNVQLPLFLHSNKNGERRLSWLERQFVALKAVGSRPIVLPEKTYKLTAYRFLNFYT